MTPIYIVFIVIALYLAYGLMRIIWYSIRAVQNGKKDIRFSHYSDVKDMSILVAGDSIAYGTGCVNSQNTIAGRLFNAFSRTHKNVHMENIAVNGLRLKHLITQLEGIESHYNILIINIGGIDTLLCTPFFMVKRHVRRLLPLASNIADTVIFVSPSNIGSAPMFMFPYNLLMQYRSQKIRNVFIEYTKKYNIVYVDLYTTRAQDPLQAHHTYLYASDNIHPNDEGYGVWFEKIKGVLESRQLLV